MIKGFYNITEKIKDALKQDAFVNTVTYGDIFKVDLQKVTVFPLSHLIVTNAIYNQSSWTFTLSLISMDIVDDNKQDVTDLYEGNDNELDVLNTQLAVQSRLIERLQRGDLYTDLYQLNGNPTFEPFTDRFANKVAGWTCTFNVDIANDMTTC